MKHLHFYLCCILITCLALPVAAQSRYNLSPRDRIVLTTSILAAGTGHYLVFTTPPPASTSPLNPQTINPFDRPATTHWSRPLQNISHATVGLSALAASSLYFHRPIRQDFWTTTIMGLETILFTDAAVTLTKGIIRRPRPFMYNPDAPFQPKTESAANNSFISGHAAFSAAACFFTAQVLHDHYPQARWRKWVWTGAATLPAITSYLRFRGGKHFPTDLIAGYTVGLATGILIPRLHRSQTQPTSFHLTPTPNGISFTYTF